VLASQSNYEQVQWRWLLEEGHAATEAHRDQLKLRLLPFDEDQHFLEGALIEAITGRTCSRYTSNHPLSPAPRLACAQVLGARRKART